MRGLPLRFHPHAVEELLKERCTEHDVEHVLEEPDHDKEGTAWRRKGGRTLIVRYRQRESYILVHGFSATRRKLSRV